MAPRSLSVTGRVCRLASSTPISALLHPGTQGQPVHLPPAEAWCSPVAPPTEWDQDWSLGLQPDLLGLLPQISPLTWGGSRGLLSSRHRLLARGLSTGLSLRTLGSSLGLLPPHEAWMSPSLEVFVPKPLVPASQKERAPRVSEIKPLPGPSLETETLPQSTSESLAAKIFTIADNLTALRRKKGKSGPGAVSWGLSTPHAKPLSHPASFSGQE